MCLFEFDQEKYERTIREEGLQQGLQQGIKNLLDYCKEYYKEN